MRKLFALLLLSFALVRAADTVGSAQIGQTITLGVTVNGSAPFTYQWNFNGAAVAGATNAQLVLANVQPAAAGTYTVQVANSAGSTVSNNCVVSITPVPPSGAVTTFSAK